MTTTGSDRILPATRVASFAVVVVVVLAFVVLWPWPSETDRLFAWTIQPTMTPMVLGSAYLGGAYFFGRAATADRWHTIKVGLLPLAAFASINAVATYLHWDKFNHDHVAFWLWTGLYPVTPFVVVAIWWVNHREDPGPSDTDLLLPKPVALVIGLSGVIALAMSAFLFFAPDEAAARWPWALTPLTARVMASVYALGLAGLAVCVDRRWSTARLVFQTSAVMLTLILISAVRAREELDISHILSWFVVVSFAAGLAGTLIVYLSMERASRKAPVTTPG